ncbi:hypothetical protein KCH_63390 [Kitasatospora cheerisanensis KCTC 2395]|uniref:Uncharacterized protein n=1 Tax=Kitasatospora cheerisanensis KCTC 2395 TaxID=1348663 RepID=A0A066YVE1_9ACTN|nr:hypothetical protein KCH_63390 [Kitasatospora cheerisanensis KCTC 2395]
MRRPSALIRSLDHGGSIRSRTSTWSNPAARSRRATSPAISATAGQPE